MKKIASWLTGINLIVGIVLVNVFLSFYPFWRIDLSRNRIHSLSAASKKIVRELDDVVNVDVYMSQNLPANVKPVADSLKIILKEFDRLSGKLRISYYDPIKDEEAGMEAERLGIVPLQFSTVKSDKFELSNGYLGLALVYGDKEEVMPVAGDIGNMEYFLISGIKKLTEGEEKVVGLAEENWTSGESEIQYFRQFLERDYRVVDVDLSGENELPRSAQSIVVVGRQSQIGKSGVVNLEKWLDEGKGLVAFLDKIAVDGAMQAEKIEDEGLWPLFEERGIRVKDGLVWDESSAIANFRAGQSVFLSQYPYWVQVRAENINREIPAVSGIDSIMLAWVAPIEIEGEARELFSSSSKSVIDESFFNLSPAADPETVPEGEMKKSILAAVNTKNGRVALVADSDFIKDQFVVSNQQNIFLALNLVDYMSADESLMGIRSKVVSSAPLKPVEDEIKMTVKALNIALPIVLLAAIGTWGNYRRKKNNGEETDDKKK